ncbi:C-GCAxxG-C-C family protein [Aromatoleum toluclasticum]|uniref:C-GCAxxG-C-C family protein n=1 Tax=Aromatoleum toluclasticum TaxID=92003 RepID=UPI001D18CFB6|nr:C-GCAxxG-C-C family protein [Aromatoleum toluclasticum]MCC4113978.1 C-GCAxxG-C-C family protein [Aromatoleum toluclasticum]
MVRHIGSAQTKAEASFDGGLYCAESVVRALVGTSEDADLLTRAATGFCSGMARTCGPCGALSGGIIGIGHVLGRAQAGAPVAAAYAAVQDLVGEFERIFGARDCDRLLGCDLGSPEGQAIFRELQLHRRCREFTARAAELASAAIARHQQPAKPNGT